MAKMFYTMEETKVALGRNEEGIKQLAREGRLREFRDGPRLMFKADQVETLKAELGGGGGDAISLSPTDSGAPLSLADSGGRGGSGVSLSDSAAGTRLPGDTHTASATGDAISLSGGSVSGVPSPGRSGTAAGASAAGTRAGITIFDVDDASRADPSAQTAINSNVQDQINLEGVGSGSGLLDLTRESDDTSLGAVFDELTPGGGRKGGGATAAGVAMSAGAADDLTAPMERAPRAALAAPIYVEQADPMASSLGWASVGATAILMVVGFLLTSVLLGYRPSLLDSLQQSGFMFLAIGVGVTIILAVVGFVVGKGSAR